MTDKTKLKTKHLNLVVPFEVKENGDDSSNEGMLKVEGYANTEVKDRMGDIILPTAWERGGLENFRKNPVMLSQHDHRRAIGKFTDVRTDAKGLYVEGVISKSEPEIQTKIKENILKAFSVGFIIKDADYVPDTGTLYITDAELLEVSVVSVPANQDSLFQVAKNFDTAEEYEEYRKAFAKNETKDESEEKSDSDNQEESDGSDSAINKGDPTMDTDVNEEVVKDPIGLEADAREEKAKEAEKAPEAEAEAATEEKEVAKPTTKSTAEKAEEAIEAAVEAGDTEKATSIAKEAKEDLVAKRKHVYANKASNESKYSGKEVTDAFFLSKVKGRNFLNTDMGQDVVASNKGVAADSAVGIVTDLVTTEIRGEYEDELRVTPLFESIMCRAKRNPIPVADEEDDSSVYVKASGQYVAPGGTDAVAATQADMQEIELTPHTFTTRFRVDYEDDEDVLLSVIPFQRKQQLRKMAKRIDRSLLLGDGSSTMLSAKNAVAGPAANFSLPCPFAGVVTLVKAQSNLIRSTANANARAKSADVNALRAVMGKYSLSDRVVMLGSYDVRNVLVEDENFVTVDKVGPRAGILTGEIGSMYGVPFIPTEHLSGTGSNNVPMACMVYLPGFVIGKRREMMIESEREPSTGTISLYMSTRLDFKALTTQGTAAKPTLATSRYTMGAVLQTGTG